MNNIEDLANWLSDLDISWSPFLFLRPQQDEPLTSTRVLQLAALYGVFAGVAIDAFLAASAHVAGPSAAALPSPFLFPLALTAGFFLVYRTTFAVAWNVRAERLSGGPKGSSRLEAWRSLATERDDADMDAQD